MSRPTAAERLRRLLALIPWLVDHPGASIDEVCARFEIDRQQLHDDLEVVWMVGLPPYTPDQLVDVVIEDDRIWIHLGDYFRSPLRLSPDQALALVAAASGLVAAGQDGDGSAGALARGLAKLATSLGVDPTEAVDVHLGDASAELVRRLQAAVADHRRVRIDYYSYGRDERSVRLVDPHRVFAEAGQWYLAANCHTAGGDRLFRIDRIVELEEVDEHFDPPTSASTAFDLDEGSVVRLELAAEARWVLDQFPHTPVDVPDGEGPAVIDLVVTAQPWLDRLLLQLGDQATVRAVDGRPGDGGARQRAAARVLARYR